MISIYQLITFYQSFWTWSYLSTLKQRKTFLSALCYILIRSIVPKHKQYNYIYLSVYILLLIFFYFIASISFLSVFRYLSIQSIVPNYIQYNDIYLSAYILLPIFLYLFVVSTLKQRKPFLSVLCTFVLYHFNFFISTLLSFYPIHST